MTQADPRLVAVLVVLLSGGVAGCRKQDSGREAPAVVHASAPAQGGITHGAGDLRVVGRSMRVTMNVSLQVDDVQGSADALRKEAADLGGFVSESGLHEDRGRVRSASMTLRVPTAKLSALRAKASSLGKITSENEKAEDVTDQVTDLDARLRNARAREKRLLEMLEGRPGGLTDVLALEKELASARETVESLDAQKRNLDGEVELATVHVSLGEVGDVTQAGAGARIARAGRDGVENLGTMIVSSTVLVASLGPSALVLLGVLYGMFRLVRAAHRWTEHRRRSLEG